MLLIMHKKSVQANDKIMETILLPSCPQSYFSWQFSYALFVCFCT